MPVFILRFDKECVTFVNENKQAMRSIFHFHKPCGTILFWRIGRDCLLLQLKGKTYGKS